MICRSTAQSRGAWLISQGQGLLLSGFCAGALVSCVSQQQEWCAASAAAMLGHDQQAGAPMRIAAKKVVRRWITSVMMRITTHRFNSFFQKL
jgi:hypothetical protein